MTGCGRSPGLDPAQPRRAAAAGPHPPRRLRSSADTAGSTSCRSPITAYSATDMIGASGSVLTARIRFAPFAARDVLGGARDAAGDVDLRRDLRPGLADLVGVRAPAGHRDRAGAADGATEERRQLLDRGEALGRAHAASARDDDLRVRERDAARRRRGSRSLTRTTRSASESSGANVSTEPGAPSSAAATACGVTVSSAVSAWRTCILEEAAAPARSGSAASGVPGVTAADVGGERLAEPRRGARHRVRRVRGAGRDDRRGPTRSTRPTTIAAQASGAKDGEGVVLGDVRDGGRDTRGSLGSTRPDQEGVRPAPRATPRA